MVSYNTAIGPIFTFTKFLGLFPYRVPSGPLPKAQRLLSLALNFIVIGIGVTTILKDLSKKIWITLDFFRFLRRIFARMWFILSVATHIFWQIHRPQKIERILKKLHSFNAFIGSQHFTCYNIPITVFGLLTYGIMLPAVIMYIGNPNNLDVIGGVVIPFVHNVLFLAQFFTFMEVIHCNFLKLNHLTLSAMDLEMCTRIHAELCVLTKEVNQVYNVELLMSFVSWLASLITQWFQLHEALTKGEPHAAFLITLPWISGFQFVQMWSLCHISYEVHYQSDCFSDSLCCAMRKKYPPSYSRKLTLYLARRPSARITAFGLFSVDTGILATILGTTMTYFIVLVQLY